MLSIIAMAAVLNTQDLDTGDAYRACAEISGRRARLRCYDEAAASDQVLLAATAEEATAAEAVPPAQTEQLTSGPALLEDSVDDAEARAADAERRAQEAEAALKAAEARANSAEIRAGIFPDTFTDGVKAQRLQINGMLLIRLENGTLWEQISGGRRLKERDLNKMQTVTMERGLFGGWTMAIEPLGATIPVRQYR